MICTLIGALAALAHAEFDEVLPNLTGYDLVRIDSSQIAPSREFPSGIVQEYGFLSFTQWHIRPGEAILDVYEMTDTQAAYGLFTIWEEGRRDKRPISAHGSGKSTDRRASGLLEGALFLHSPFFPGPGGLSVLLSPTTQEGDRRAEPPSCQRVPVTRRPPGPPFDSLLRGAKGPRNESGHSPTTHRTPGLQGSGRGDRCPV